MVQLKDNHWVNIRPLPEISIPYGSIKSVCPLLCSGRCNSFQFLMVQLKAEPQLQRSFLPILFQFLMVQLKDSTVQTGD